MNMLRVEDEILCETFVKLTSIPSGEEIVLLGKTLLFMKEGSVSEAIAYIRKQ